MKRSEQLREHRDELVRYAESRMFPAARMARDILMLLDEIDEQQRPRAGVVGTVEDGTA